MINWYVGWSMILAAFVGGALLGLFFHREDFLGGYASFRRRILRLGHIALPALGMINLLFSLSSWPAPETTSTQVASVCLVVGGVTMSLVCFLCAWRQAFRYLFIIP